MKRITNLIKKNFIYVLVVAVILWFIASWVEVVYNNDHHQPNDSKWNFFGIILEIGENIDEQ